MLRYNNMRHRELPLSTDSSNLFLKVMISIAVFLFAVTLAGVLSINSMLVNWNSSILGSLTVQIIPVNGVDKLKAKNETLIQEQRAAAMLEAMPEVQKVTPLNDGQLERLLKPWLGDDVDLSNLPMPRLIDVKLKKDAEINFMALAEKLATVAPQASLDNHKLWLNKLINFASGLKMLALSVLALVIGITSGAIFYSTQTSLGLHKDIIEILHLLGAKDTYIAQQYAAKTAVLGFWGGLIGVVFAVPTIFVIAHLAQQIEGGIINEARLSWGAWTVIFSLPLFSMLVAMQTAYYTVKRTLEKMMSADVKKNRLSCVAYRNLRLAGRHDRVRLYHQPSADGRRCQNRRDRGFDRRPQPDRRGGAAAQSGQRRAAFDFGRVERHFAGNPEKTPRCQNYHFPGDYA